MKRITATKKQRPTIRHENTRLGEGAGIAHGYINVPGHNAFPMPGTLSPPPPSSQIPLSSLPGTDMHAGPSSRAQMQPDMLAAASDRQMPAREQGAGFAPDDAYATAPMPTSTPSAESVGLSVPPADGLAADAMPSRPRVRPPKAARLPSPTPAAASTSMESVPAAQAAPLAVAMDPYMRDSFADAWTAPAPPGASETEAPPTSTISTQPTSAGARMSGQDAPPIQARAPERRSAQGPWESSTPRTSMMVDERPASPEGHVDVRSRLRPRREPKPPRSPVSSSAAVHGIPSTSASTSASALASTPAVTSAPAPGLDAAVATGASTSAAAAAMAPSGQEPLHRLGSLTQERELAEARRKQKLRLLRSAERERHTPHLPRVMQPRRGRPVEAYVDQHDSPNFRTLQAVLRKIKSEWDFLLDTDFNPVQLSMALLSHGPLRAYMGDFSSLAGMIERALQSTVGDHYNSFASAITVNHGMIASLSASQDSISGARQQLQSARDALGTRRADLVQMWQRMQSVKEAMRVLTLLEQLRDVPDELESLMTEKRFLEATHLLMRSLRMIQRDDIAELGAAADLRAYLRSQEHSLLDILIEELQSHLYLKSYWCDARWRSYVPGQETLPDMVLGAPGTGERAWTTLTQFLGALRARIPYEIVAGMPPAEAGVVRDAYLHWDGSEETKPEALSRASPKRDATQTAEDDSFLYLEMLLESLMQLGKIGYALDTVSQLLSTELHQLVDKTIEQVEARHVSHSSTAPVRLETVLFAPHAVHSVLDAPGSASRPFLLRGLPDSSLSRMTASADHAALQHDTEIMRDFVWTLFSKLEAVLAAHRAVQEVASVLISRANPHDAGAADRASAETGVAALARVWDAVEHEIHMLLLDYLVEDSDRTVVSQHVPSLETVLRMTRFERERNVLFRLNYASRPSAAVREASEVVDEALDAYVPGLVGQDTALPFVLEPRTRTDEYLGAGHRRLVKPLTFTASILLPPTLQFVQRAEQVLPADAAHAADFGRFLREFVQERFLPLLGEQVHALVQGASSAPDAFHAEPAARVGVSRAVVRSSVQLVSLVESLYAMLQAAPFEQAGFANLIIAAFLVYYEACNARFKRLVAEDADSANGPYLLAAVWAQRPELYACLATALDAPPSSTRAVDVCRAEARTELHMAEGLDLKRSDLITSRKRHLALGTLHHTLHWLGMHIAQFHVDPAAGDVASSAPSVAATPTSSANADGRTTALPLPVASGTQSLWQDVPSMYAMLAKCVLMTLRVELRLKTLYYLRAAVLGSYVCDALSMEPDAHVVELNTELGACHEVYKETMLPTHHAYVFDGLDVLMDTIMTEAVLHVTAINRYGVTKMLRNLLSLQQNLKNIVDEPRRIDLDRSKRLWEMLAREPEHWLSTAQDTYSAAEYLAMVRLSFGWGLDNAPIPHAGTSQQPVSDERFRACVDMLDAALKRDVSAT